MRHQTGDLPRPAQLSGSDAAEPVVYLRMFKSRITLLIMLLCLPLVGANCNPPAVSPPGAIISPGRIQTVLFNDPVRTTVVGGSLQLRGARNEWLHVALQLNQFSLPAIRKSSILRFAPLKAGDSVIAPSTFSLSQLLPVTIDTNRAGFVRNTGMAISTRQVPRALLPLKAEGGTLSLTALRNPEFPFRPSSPDEIFNIAPIVWMDILIPPLVNPGQYQGACELVEEGKVTANLPIMVTVDDFILPDQRHLVMVGGIDWPDLIRLYPKAFKGLVGDRPQLLSRRESQDTAAVRVLDELVKLAQLHRLQVVIPQLQPTVKWPSGNGPQIDWEDFDSVVAPWMKGDVFPDITPLGYWPIPFPDNLDKHASGDQRSYWQAAAAHFDSLDWLSRASITLGQPHGRASLLESITLSEQAARILADHPKVRVTLPLEEEQVHLATADFPRRIPSDRVDRVMYAMPGIVSALPLQRLPKVTSQRWLRTDIPGLIPYSGAGADEREVRLWAWLAFLRDAQLIQWPSVLPSLSDPTAPGDPDELTWFYPGSWFGIDQPLPTLQLKWLRRAQQDYEYLYLARQRNQAVRALLLARLLAKPVELQPTQVPDPAYSLLSGTTDPKIWNEGLELLTRSIILNQPGQTADAAADRQLALDTTTWSTGQERPCLMARSCEWSLGKTQQGQPVAGLHLGIDIYNAADRTAEKSTLQFSTLPEAWDTIQTPVDVPRLGIYHVDRFFLDSRVMLNQVVPASRQPNKIAFVDGYSGRIHYLQVCAPVAVSERRQGAPPKMDGNLADWIADDALHDGRLVQMLGRPTVQNQLMPLAPTSSTLYSTYNATTLFLGFKVDGVETPPDGYARSYVEREFRRAWGEDICELLIQPLYGDGSLGPVLNIAVKPHGQLEISRRLDPHLHASPWQAFSGTDIRYGATLDQKIWRGEVSVPWDAILDEAHAGKKPDALRFNFTQHRGLTGQSSSWAGPIDFGRDEALMGLLFIKP